jgi:hypothetical protein
VLTAKVFDKGGNVLPQATVKWIYTPLAPGAPAQELGTGNPLIVTLPAGATMSWGWIRADASVQVGPGIDRSAILDKRNPKAVVSRLGTGDPRKTLVKGPPVPSYVLKAHASIKVETGTVL